MDALYDVAISFLGRDELIAVEICNDLSETLRVFVYSKRQEELAGTDGLESFRKTFLLESRLIVVLYRDGWGKTRWTAIEELAIKERMFNGGWNSLLFVMLDENSTLPGWLPETLLRLNYASYGEALTGAIKMRAQELGSVLTVETAVEKAKRVQSNELARAERESLLTNQGQNALRSEHSALRKRLDETIADVRTQLTTINLESGADARVYIIRSERASLSFCLLNVSAPVTESCIVVEEFDRPLILPGSNYMYFPGEGPRKISEEKFYFDYTAAHGWCWRQPRRNGNMLTTSGLAEYLVKRVLEIHEQFKTGKRVRHRQAARSYSDADWMR